MSQDSPGKSSFGDGFFQGLGLGLVQALVTWGILLVANSYWVIVIGIRFFGLVQLIYMVPLFLFRRRGQPFAAAGLAVAACFIAMINISFTTMH